MLTTVSPLPGGRTGDPGGPGVSVLWLGHRRAVGPGTAVVRSDSRQGELIKSWCHAAGELKARVVVVVPGEPRRPARDRLMPRRPLHDTWEGIGDTIRFMWRQAQRETRAKAIGIFVAMLALILLLGVMYGAVLWIARSF